MANKTFATYLSELSAVTSLGAGDKLPVLESSTVKYVDGGDIGGGVLAVEDKASSFTVNGQSGTVYTNYGAGAIITGTLENSATGTTYTFFATNAEGFVVLPPSGATIDFLDGASGTTATNADGIIGTVLGHCVVIVKYSATKWIATSNHGFSLNAG